MLKSPKNNKIMGKLAPCSCFCSVPWPQCPEMFFFSLEFLPEKEILSKPFSSSADPPLDLSLSQGFGKSLRRRCRGNCHIPGFLRSHRFWGICREDSGAIPPLPWLPGWKTAGKELWEHPQGCSVGIPVLWEFPLQSHPLCCSRMLFWFFSPFILGMGCGRGWGFWGQVWVFDLWGWIIPEPPVREKRPKSS